MRNQRTRTNFIAVHCSATAPSVDVTEAMLRNWHTAQGWSDAGYNVVIRRSGLIEIARPLDDVGAHVAGFNDQAVGVCLAGGLKSDAKTPDEGISAYTYAQQQSLLVALRFLKAYAPQARIQGHRDFPNVKKACPCFDVRAWLADVAPDLLVDATTKESADAVEIP